MSDNTRNYTVQLLSLREIAVVSQGEIQALQDALARLRPSERHEVIYARIPEADPRWFTMDEIDLAALARECGLPPGEHLHPHGAA